MKPIEFVTRPATLGEMVYLQRFTQSHVAGSPDVEALFNLLKSRAADGTPAKVLLNLTGDALVEACADMVKSLQASIFLHKLSVSLGESDPHKEVSP